VKEPVKLGSVFFDCADADAWNGEEFGRAGGAVSRDRVQGFISEDAEGGNAPALGFGKTPGAEGGLDSGIRGNRSGCWASARPAARRSRHSLRRVGHGALFRVLGFLGFLLATGFEGRGRRGLHPEIELRSVFDGWTI